jgi:hypothetical protein
MGFLVAFTKMNDASLDGVVSSLHLGEVDNVTAHRSSSNEATVCKVGKLIAVGVSALLLLAAPVVGGELGTVECAIKINTSNIAVVLESSVDHRALGPGNTSVGDEYVKTAIEFFDNVVDGLLNGLRIGDLDLIGLGYRSNRVRMSLCKS